MDNDDNKPEYEVGYKKPPIHSRFKSGASGNPKGRRKNLVDLKDVVIRELNQKVRIREGDQELRVSKQAALIKSLMNRAIKGENQAVRDVLALMSRLIRLQDDDGNMDQLREEDLKILDGYMQRQKDGDVK